MNPRQEINPNKGFKTRVFQQGRSSPQHCKHATAESSKMTGYCKEPETLKPLKLNKVVKTTVNEREQLDLIASRIPAAIVAIPQRCMLEMCACNV
jgi:hypothetical protein